MIRRRLVPRFGAWNATLLVGAGYLVVMGICFQVLPAFNEVPQLAIPGVIDAVADAVLTFPSTVVWDFRIASLGVQAVMWTVIAVAFGPLAERVLEPDRVRVPARRPHRRAPDTCVDDTARRRCTLTCAASS